MAIPGLEVVISLTLLLEDISPLFCEASLVSPATKTGSVTVKEDYIELDNLTPGSRIKTCLPIRNMIKQLEAAVPASPEIQHCDRSKSKNIVKQHPASSQTSNPNHRDDEWHNSSSHTHSLLLQHRVRRVPKMKHSHHKKGL